MSFTVTHNPGATLQGGPATLQDRVYFSLAIERLPNGGYIIGEGRLSDGDYRQALAGFTEKHQALEWIASNLK